MMKHSRASYLALMVFFHLTITHCHEVLSQALLADVMFYNVENLFDTIDDPLTIDEEFLPDGRYRWNSERYQHKLDQLARVISADGQDKLPALVGLCEIENRRVLEDLVATERLKKAGYSIVHYDSPDERGIDVALLYQPTLFRVLSSEPLPVRVPFDLDFRTRDILYVQGILGNDTLHVYVNHWPSRRGGTEFSEPKRVQAANVLRTHLDRLAPRYRTFHVFIMGDMNDEPNDRSVKEVLGAMLFGTECKGDQKSCLYNLSFFIPEGEGTYYYWREKKWNVLDHMILSSSLLGSCDDQKVGEIRCRWSGFSVPQAPWMLKEDDGEWVPFSSYARDYEGGFSDHLPVRIMLVVKTEPVKRTWWMCRKKK